jgi:hypothetical protein
MPEGETLPRGKTSKEWLDYADKKLGLDKPVIFLIDGNSRCG